MCGLDLPASDRQHGGHQPSILHVSEDPHLLECYTRCALSLTHRHCTAHLLFRPNVLQQRSTGNVTAQSLPYCAQTNWPSTTPTFNCKSFYMTLLLSARRNIKC